MTPQKTKTPPRLSDDYYLQNFDTLIKFVHQHYQALLTEDEQQLFTRYTNLPVNSQRLFIRLVTRSNDYFRYSKLNYSEISDLSGALGDLRTTGFISDADETLIPEWLPLFSKPEVAAVLPITGVATVSASIEATLFTNRDLFGARPLDLLLENESVAQIHHKQLFQTYRLLFFGNLYQDFSTFVLRDLGVRKFENYLTDSTLLPFKSREQIDAHLLYYHCADQYEAAEVAGQQELITLYQQLPQSLYNDAALTRRVEKLAYKIARQLERFDALTDAQNIYNGISRPPARERLARVTDKLGHSEEAFNLCQKIEANPTNAEEEEFAQQFSAKLAKKLKINYTAPEKLTPLKIQLSLPRTSLPVEFAAALHFAKTGKCYYVENSLISGILGLAIWDIVFAPIPGAFYHPFQTAPSDFHETEFYTLRKSLLDRRVQEIKEGQLATYVLTHYHHKNGIGNPLVHWHQLNRYLITLALQRIPVDHWLMLLEYLLRDIRNNRSGLPDLIYFPDPGRGQLGRGQLGRDQLGSYQLLEVKGPGDRLQKNQLRWMRQFSDCGIDHAVVLVDYLPDTDVA